MKHKRSAALLAMIASLGFSACSPIIVNRDSSSSEAPITTSSSEQKEDDKPVEIDELLKPFSPKEITPIDPSVMDQALVKATGSENHTFAVKFVMGELYEYLLSHSHMTVDEMNYLIDFVLSGSVDDDSLSDGFRNYTLIKSIVNLFSRVNSDDLLATLQELTKEQYYADLVRTLIIRGGTGYKTGYLAAYRFFKDAGEEHEIINKVYDNYHHYLNASLFEDEADEFTQTIIDLINDEQMYVAFRGISKIAKSLKKYVGLGDELKAVIYLIGSDMFNEEEQDEIVEFLFTDEKILDVLHGFGDFLGNINMGVEGLRVFVDKLGLIAKAITIHTNFETDDLMYVEDFERINTIIETTVIGLDPVGLKALFSLLSSVFKDITAYEMELAGLQIQEESLIPEGMTQDEMFNELVAYYDNHYNLLTEEQKGALETTLAALGISLSRTVESVKDAIAKGESETINDILNAQINEQLSKRFDFTLKFDKASFQNYPTFIFRKDTNVTFAELDFHINLSYRDDNGQWQSNTYSGSQLSFTKDKLDTSELGTHYFFVRVDGYLFKKAYFVLDSSFDSLNLRDYNRYADWGRLDEYGNFTGVYEEGDVRQYNGITYVKKGADISDIVVDPLYKYEYFVYDETTKQFMNVQSYRYAHMDTVTNYDIYISFAGLNPDVNTVGEHFVFATISLTTKDGASHTYEHYVTYQVVENFDDVERIGSSDQNGPYDVPYSLY